MTTAEQSLKSLKTYTLEEIDHNLAQLSNLLRFSRKCNKDDVRKQINIWLDRRCSLVEVSEVSNGA